MIMAKNKYKVLCDRMQGTVFDCKKGQVIEIESTSDNVKSLVKRGWLEEVKSIKEYYKTYGDKLPKELKEELTALERRLKA